MPTKIGRFEILNEIAKSERGSVYKANDPESNQTVALKTVRLEMPAEEAKALLERIMGEADGTKSLSSQNVAVLYGAGEFDNVFCAAMEYVQGNSIATMLARKEGFSIWDLLDIGRQVCQALDYISSQGVVHHSLEPAKIMVQWDGTVKILSLGVSQMTALESASGKIPVALPYASPEQIGGQPLDGRSNLFTWGAILYEMVTDQQAFGGEDPETVRRKIVEEMPVPPGEINAKIHPAVSALVMKALAKSPEERFQSGQELIAELEKCKQASTTPAKKAEVPKSSTVARSAVASKFVSGAVKGAPNPTSAKLESRPEEKRPPAAPSRLGETKPASQGSAQVDRDTGCDEVQHGYFMQTQPPPKASAAAAGWSGGSYTAASASGSPSGQFISSCVKASVEAMTGAEASMSSATVEQEEPAPKIAVDPMMTQGPAAGQKQVSFSDLNELPPLKEAYVPPAPPVPAQAEEAPEPTPLAALRSAKQEKPKVPPKEAAQKAIKEIKSVPPKLMGYSIAGALLLILVIIAGIAYHIHSQNADDDSGPAAAPATPVQAAAPAPAPALPPQPTTAIDAPQEVQPQVEVAPVVKSRRKKAAAAPAQTPVAVIPGQLSIDSSPEGAQVQIDGHSDPSWVTPYNVPGLIPGQHTVSVLKAGFTSETRTVDVAAGSKSFLVIHLAQMAATVSVGSDPAGASVWVDGKDSGRVTPTQITVEKGTHKVAVKKAGYLDESASADLQPGQVFRFSPSLKQLGNVDDMKSVGRFKKMFGGGDAASMGGVSIKTQPKGAQIAVNQRMLDKGTPTEFLLPPGHYVVDITMPGYQSVQKIISVDKGGKVMIDEVLTRE